MGGLIEDDHWHAAREAMVRETVEARGIHDPDVLRAMRAVPRERFVPSPLRSKAYADEPLALPDGQSISQPYIVAEMAALAEVRPGTRVLDVGTGSGYQAAVLAEIGAQVWSVERIPSLAATARSTLDAAGYGAVSVHVADGREGWPAEAPYDAILVAAATERVPEPLLDQLAVEGRLVIPVGDEHHQELVVFQRMPWGEITRHALMRVLFVPLV